MSDFVRLILSLSLSGTILAGMLLLIKPLIKGKVSKAFSYYIWLVILIRMICPISTENSIMHHLIFSSSESAWQEDVYDPSFRTVGDETSSPVGSSTLSKQQNADIQLNPPHRMEGNTIVLYVWLIGAFWAFLYSAISYRFFVAKVKRWQGAVSSDEQALSAKITQGKAALIRSSFTNTPILIGLLHPVIAIPDRKYSPEQLRSILSHEFTHMRRYDIAYKWFILFVSSVHWFNPMMLLIKAEIRRAGELSCDEAVIESLDSNAKQIYGETLLHIASSDESPQGGLSATMSSQKKYLKERLIFIMEHKQKSKGMILIACMVGVITILSAGVLGAYALDRTKGKAMDSLPSTVQTQPNTSNLNKASTSPTPGADVIRLSLPSVKSYSNTDLSIGSKEAIEAFWDIDFPDMEMEMFTDKDNKDVNPLYPDEISVDFLPNKQPKEQFYHVSIDKNTKQIVELGSLVHKSDRPASAFLRDEYISAASAVLSDKFGVQTPGKADCYLPFMMREVKTDYTVYVFFPDLTFYVELSLSDLHPIGYRLFSDTKSMASFIQLHTRAL